MRRKIVLNMNRKIIFVVLVVILIALAGGVLYLINSLKEQVRENEQMLELAEMDKLEMQNEYQNFACKGYQNDHKDDKNNLTVHI